MKKKLTIIIPFALILILLFTAFPTAYAADAITTIHEAADESELEAAIRQSGVMADEAGLLDALDADTKAAVLGSVFRRRMRCEDMTGFKEMFGEQYARKASVMSWASGYPYAEEGSLNGTDLVVKTDIDGWVYIIAVPDNVQGGVGDEYSFMKLYDADNGIYKKKVWVQGGVESTILVSCGAAGTINDYRIYYCLRTAGNESGFGEAAYTTMPPADYYRWDLDNISSLYFEGVFIKNFRLYLIASQNSTYTMEFYLTIDGSVTFVAGYTFEYTTPYKRDLIASIAANSFEDQPQNYYYMRLLNAFEDGTTSEDYMDLK